MRSVRMPALAIALLALAPSPASAQSTRTLEEAAVGGLSDALAPIVGVMGAALLGVLDLYYVGVSLDLAIREGNGFAGALGIAELGGAAANFLIGGLLTWVGVSDDDDAYLAIGIPALAFGAFYFVHGIYSLIDPSPGPPPSTTPAIVPRAGGATLEIAGTF